LNSAIIRNRVDLEGRSNGLRIHHSRAPFQTRHFVARPTILETRYTREKLACRRQ